MAYMVSHEDLLYQFVSWHNDWVFSGNFSRMLGMMSETGRLYFTGPLFHDRLVGKAAIETYLQTQKPAEPIDVTHVAETAIGAQGTFRWAKQDGNDDAGQLTIEIVNGQIVRVAFHFYPWIDHHPVPWIKAKRTAPVAAPKPAPKPAPAPAPAPKPAYL